MESRTMEYLVIEDEGAFIRMTDDRVGYMHGSLRFATFFLDDANGLEMIARFRKTKLPGCTTMRVAMTVSKV